MKSLIVLVLLLFMLTAPAFAEGPVSTPIQDYLNDEIVLSMREKINPPDSIVGYCMSIGAVIYSLHGDNPPALLEFGINGINASQDANTYMTACSTLTSIVNNLDADGIRAIAYVLGTMTIKVDKSAESIDAEVGARFMQSLKTNNMTLTSISIIDLLLEGAKQQPNGLNKEVIGFFKPAFQGSSLRAVKALRLYRPDAKVKKALLSVDQKTS